MTVADFAKLLARRPQRTEKEDFEHDHSLKAIAREHAANAGIMRTGTAFDWEDLERYQEEFARLEREGAGTPKQH